MVAIPEMTEFNNNYDDCRNICVAFAGHCLPYFYVNHNSIHSGCALSKYTGHCTLYTFILIRVRKADIQLNYGRTMCSKWETKINSVNCKWNSTENHIKYIFLHPFHPFPLFRWFIRPIKICTHDEIKWWLMTSSASTRIYFFFSWLLGWEWKVLSNKYIIIQSRSELSTWINSFEYSSKEAR